MLNENWSMDVLGRQLALEVPPRVAMYWLQRYKGMQLAMFDETGTEWGLSRPSGVCSNLDM